MLTCSPRRLDTNEIYRSYETDRVSVHVVEGTLVHMTLFPSQQTTPDAQSDAM